jgi:hypothetical protein
MSFDFSNSDWQVRKDEDPSFIDVSFRGEAIQDGVSLLSIHRLCTAPQNCKMFNWTGLPTKLKERVILLCMHEPLKSTPSKRRRQGRETSEVIDQFGSWKSLLWVSHQVRALALRLRFIGSSYLALGAGLCLDVTPYLGFNSCVRRLGEHYQMTDANGVPTNDKTLALAKTYKQFPNIYPQLEQYAIFRHGIRKICMQMDFLNYFHFFKVTAGNFEQYWKPYLDYEGFDMLPHLKELIILLPDLRGRLEDTLPQNGPRLFYNYPFACPRILGRLIYEQAAEMLVHRDKVSMHGFIDELQGMRFYALRKKAIENLKFTSQELEELYAQDGGGIELEDSVIPGVEKEKTYSDIVL